MSYNGGVRCGSLANLREDPGECFSGACVGSNENLRLAISCPCQGHAPEKCSRGFAFGAPVLDDVAWSKRSKRVKLPDGFWRNAVARQVFLQGEGKDRNGSAFGSTLTMHRCRGSGKQRSLGNSRRVGFASPSTTHQEAMKYGKKDNEIANRLRINSDAFLTSPEWKELRKWVLAKYGPKCMKCGYISRGKLRPNVDHIKPRKLFPELALVEDNLQILCGRCNKRKGNKHCTDYRPDQSPCRSFI